MTTCCCRLTQPGAQQDEECERGRQRAHSKIVPEDRSQFKGYEWGITRRQIGSTPAASDRVDPLILEDPASTQFPHTTGCEAVVATTRRCDGDDVPR